MVELNQDEVLEIEGGSVVITVFTIFAGYMLFREVARDQGRAKAYEELGY